MSQCPSLSYISMSSFLFFSFYVICFLWPSRVTQDQKHMQLETELYYHMTTTDLISPVKPLYFPLNSLHTARSCSILHQDNQTENQLLPLTSSPFPPRCPPKHTHCTNLLAFKSLLLFFMTTTLVYLNQLLVPIFCLLNTPFPLISPASKSFVSTILKIPSLPSTSLQYLSPTLPSDPFIFQPCLLL